MSPFGIGVNDMFKEINGTDGSQLGPHSASRATDSFSWMQFFDRLHKVFPKSKAAVVTTMPCGSLQIAQGSRIPVSLLRSYRDVFAGEDHATWRVITNGRAIRDNDAWDGFASSRFHREFLQPLHLRHVAAAPLKSPMLSGYAGALCLWRQADRGVFTDADLDQLLRFSNGLNDDLADSRRQREGADCAQKRPLSHRSAHRQFIFDRHLHSRLHSSDDLAATMDADLLSGITRQARIELDRLDGQRKVSVRRQLPDQHGDLWNFRVVTHRDYPALGGGPHVFFCLEPTRCDWSVVRVGDFQADEDLARLIPAMKYMQQEFIHGPTLVEIARQVDLSPFHFHRQFAELLGLTPKHFMLELQVSRAKRELIAREKTLKEIAGDCGFAHQSHFTSRFKQATGLTPTRWRRLAEEFAGASHN